MRYYTLNFIAIALAQATAASGESKGYIVTLHPSKARSAGLDDHLDSVRELFSNPNSVGIAAVSNNDNSIGYQYNFTHRSYSARFSPSVLDKVKLLPEVAAVEEDKVYRISAIQRGAPWGLARISSPRGNGSERPSNYQFDPMGGTGVAVYVIDTGININHPEFEGRAQWGANLVPGSMDADENGHGTHCAGTVGSRRYGVAKRATLVAVKVLDGQGEGANSNILAGIDWAIRDRRGRKGNVLNLSLGGGRSEALNRAVRAAVDAGFLVSVAAGNDNINACNVSPASEPSVITVGATTIDDTRAYFSNWGQCLDVFAPGDQIESTSASGRYSEIMSGTSMASPHVAGLAAYLISKGSREVTPASLTDYIRKTAERNVVTSPGYGSPNLLISNGGWY